MDDTVTRRGLTFKQRRQMGLTVRNIARATRVLASEGIITKDTPEDEAAELVLERLVMDNPQSFADPTLDWDAVLAFIERLIPLIMTIIALF